MAGMFPDPTSWRMAYDVDGTTVVNVEASNSIRALTPMQVRNLNSESETTSFPRSFGDQLVFLFPEVRDLHGLFYSHGGSNLLASEAVRVEVSPDSTNGVDGTWSVALPSTSQPDVRVKPAYRSPMSVSALAVKAVRLGFAIPGLSAARDLSAVHLYGAISPDQNPHRLALWHPTRDERLPPAALDWGDVPRSSSADVKFRVKNLSPSRVANDGRISIEALTDSTPSLAALHTLAVGGGAFTATAVVGDLGPGAISGQVTMRRVAPTNAELGLWTFRVTAQSTDWR